MPDPPSGASAAPTDPRPGWSPSWQKELRNQHYAAVLSSARRVAVTGDWEAVEVALMEVDTAIRSLRHRNAWSRWLAQAHRDLEDRRTDLSEAEYLAEARRR
jgi:hypothetical protein